MSLALVAGLPQSGSTLLFNIIRLSCHHSQSKLKPQKTHGYCPKLHKQSSKIFLAMRDLRDIIASTRVKNPPFKNGNVVEIAKNHIKWHNDWLPHSTYIFYYEKYKKDPLKYIEEVQKVLGLKPFMLEEIHKTVEDLPNRKEIPPEQTKEYCKGNSPQAKFYEKTRLTKTHNTNNGKIGDYKNRLPGRDVELINENFGGFLKEYGYEVS